MKTRYITRFHLGSGMITVMSTPYMASIFDGHSHIERVVYTDNLWYYILINGQLFNIDKDLPRYEVKKWYNGR